MRWVPLTLLAGCPYIFDLPIDPPLPEVDADADADADTDTDTDADTDTAPPPGPRLEILHTRHALDEVRVTFRATHDDDLLDILVSGAPGGQNVYKPVSLGHAPAHTYAVDVPWPFDCQPVMGQLDVSAVDTRGGTSSDSIALERAHVDVDGNTATPPLPWSACGIATQDQPDCVRFDGTGRVQVYARAPGASISLQRNAHTVAVSSGLFRELVSLDPMGTYQLCVQGENHPWQAAVGR